MKKLKIPLAFKLIAITVLLLAVTTALIAIRSATRFEEISVDQQEQSSRDQSRARATEVEGLLVSYVEKARVVASLLMKDTGSPEEKQKALDLTFGRDADLVAVEVIAKIPQATPMRVVNESYLKQYKLDKSFIEMLRGVQKARKMVRLEALFAGKEGHIEVRNSTIEGGAPLLTIGFPLAKDEYGAVTHVVLAEVGFDRLKKSFSSQSVGDLFLVDDEGKLLAHSSPDKEPAVLKGESMVAIPIVKAALDSTLKQGQLRFKSEEGGKVVSFTGAYTRTALGVVAIAKVSDEVILEAARAVKREAFYIAGQILSIAFFAIFVFSISITTPIENLAELTNRVAKGDFSAKANVRTRDEVGQLGQAFNHMLEGLVERDKVKSMFNKFHGSSVTDDLLKGNLELGGSKKVVTVFFSDVRGFTKFSEGHTPEEVVEMLNEYFQIMVGIINRNGGVVDKFIGDAIMAVWGAPNANERDPQNAIRACLEMRQALAELNKTRSARNQVPIKIGIGLHRGEAISGTIGSSERMEYTVIGDTVNQASRIEASTKAFGTDLLLSETLAEFVGEEFIVETAGAVEVKGKSQPLTLYKVRGYYDENKNPIVISTPYSDYEAGDADKVKMAAG
jgi:adenylate cyclase